MSNEKKVLACVDQSRFADDVVDYAAWAARRMQAPLELLHVIDRPADAASGKDHSGAIGFDAQESLLAELSSEDEARSRAARERGRIFLNRLRERAIAAGVESPDVRQRHGVVEQTLMEQEAGVRLFVLGRRGESAETTQRDLGRHVERVVRALNQPILAVTEGFRVPQRIMIAFDGGIVTRRGVEMVATSPLFRGLPLHAKPGRCTPTRMGPNDAGSGRVRGGGIAPAGRCREHHCPASPGAGGGPAGHGRLQPLAAAPPVAGQQDIGSAAVGPDSRAVAALTLRVAHPETRPGLVPGADERPQRLHKVPQTGLGLQIGQFAREAGRCARFSPVQLECVRPGTLSMGSASGACVQSTMEPG